mgnify:CR=1 FL=1
MKEQKISEFIAEARTWINTPWQQNQACKGVGVDCVRFPYAAAIACGIDLVDPGFYSNDPQGENLLNRLGEQLVLIGVIEKAYNWSEYFRENSYSKPELLKLSQVGDILVFSRSWKCPPGHLGILTDKGKIHAGAKRGVRESQLGTAKLLCAVYRFKEFF